MVALRHDLAVLGAGPAGAACALAAARRGLSVLLLDPQVGPIDKPCGEGMFPAGVAALRHLGLADAVAGARRFGAVRYVLPGADPFDVPLSEAGLALERPALASVLDAALAAEPRVHRVALRASAERVPGGFRISAEGLEARARCLAIAGGLGAASAEDLVNDGIPAARHERWGVRGRFEAARPLEAVEVHFGRGFEVYLTPLPNGRVNVALLLDPGVEVGRSAGEAMRRAVDALPRVRSALGAEVTAPSARRLRLVRPRRVAHDGAFLVGDAGGGVDPIVGCGVTIALRTGIAAAEGAQAVVAGARAGRAERVYARVYRREVAVRRCLASFLLATARVPSLARAAKALLGRSPRVLAILVDLATAGAPLGAGA